jgi:hypothetical protein
MNAQNNYMQISDTIFHSKAAINAETRDKNPFTSPAEVWFSTLQL